MSAEALISFTAAMFAILNPIGNVAIFAGMAAHRPAAERRSIALRSSIAIAVILLITVWGGELLLKLFNVQIPSLQTAGGIMIGIISLSMLQSNQSSIHDTKHTGESSSSDQDIAVVPLAMPMVAGPGAMVTVIVSTHQYKGVSANIEMSLICVIMAAIIWMGFSAAGPVTRVLGTKGLDIVTKIMGIILLAIAAAMITDGLKALLPGLA